MIDHVHAPAHLPPSGTGYQVCECGATRRVEGGNPRGDWHTCELCVPTVKPVEEPKDE